MLAHMGYAVELYLDEKAQDNVRKLRAALRAQGIDDGLDLVNETPHISLAVIPDVEDERVLDVVARFAAAQAPLTVTLEAIGSFVGPQNVLFAVPIPSPALLTAHSSLHAQLRAHCDYLPYYLPGRWVPHCSLVMRLADEQMGAAFTWLRETFKPITSELGQLGVIQFRPVVDLVRWPLAGSHGSQS